MQPNWEKIKSSFWQHLVWWTQKLTKKGILFDEDKSQGHGPWLQNVAKGISLARQQISLLSWRQLLSRCSSPIPPHSRTTKLILCHTPTQHFFQTDRRTILPKKLHLTNFCRFLPHLFLSSPGIRLARPKSVSLMETPSMLSVGAGLCVRRRFSGFKSYEKCTWRPEEEWSP